jgi:DNA-binding CsgD family transcriptional regulator
MSTVELSALWEGLISGSCKVKNWAHTEKTWSIVVSRPLVSSAPSPSPRDLKILKHVLLCGVTEQVAKKSSLSKSSISVIQQNCLRFMGINCTPSRVPGLLVAAAHAHQRTVRASRRPFPSITKITIPRPDGVLEDSLTAAEYEVIKLLVEGRSYVEIGRERNIAHRTVANQVASVFRKLGVSGRVDLLCQLAAAWVRSE